MAYGGFHPYPRRFGGGRPLLQTLHASLAAQRGTALEAGRATSTDPVWLENMAIARAICFDGWGTNQRLGHQWDPARMTDMLARWERIMRIRPTAEATEAQRRDAIAMRMGTFAGVANHAKLLTTLLRVLPDMFVAVEYIDRSQAVMVVPAAGYPWGIVIAGRWSSTTAHVLVRLQKPAGYSEGDFYAGAGKVGPVMDALLPAWCSFTWYRAPEAPGVPIAVTGGPSAGGIYCDTPNTLDNNVFAH